MKLRQRKEIDMMCPNCLQKFRERIGYDVYDDEVIIAQWPWTHCHHAEATDRTVVEFIKEFYQFLQHKMVFPKT